MSLGEIWRELLLMHFTQFNGNIGKSQLYFVKFLKCLYYFGEKTDRRSPERPSRGTAASRWDPGRTTTPRGSCWPSDCPGWGGAGAPERDGVCWRSWTRSLDGGCGLSPAGWGFGKKGSLRILQQAQFCAQLFFCFFFHLVNWPSCRHPLVRRSGTECVSSLGQRRVPDHWLRPEKSWWRQNRGGEIHRGHTSSEETAKEITKSITDWRISLNVVPM